MRNLTAKELAAQMKKHYELRREIKRKHHQSMLDSGYVLCPECGGEGECEYERPVVDYTNGGYLEGYMDTCDTCDGEGYINE